MLHDPFDWNLREFLYCSIDENILEDDGDGYDYEYDDIDGEREKALLEDDDEYNDTQPDLILHEEDDLDEEEGKQEYTIVSSVL